MKTYLFLLLLLAPIAHAKRVAGTATGAQIFSLCGQLNPSSRLLTVGAETVLIDRMSSIPNEAAAYCVVGRALRFIDKADKHWEFVPYKILPWRKELKYPVMICSVMEKGEFKTRLNQEPLTFSGATPPAQGKEFGWCADGTALPKKQALGWIFDAGQFREFPDPNQRSGMSIGNQ
jgi:hypothetical protein